MRRKTYVDPELQFPIIAILIFFATAEGALAGWGFSKVFAAAQDWRQSGQTWVFFRDLFLTIVPMVAANFAFGSYLSNKIAGPLWRIRQAMSEVARGNLEADVSPRSGDFLKSHAAAFNGMCASLRHVIWRDRKFAREADEILSSAREEISKGAAQDPGKLLRLVNEAKNRLSIINVHYTKTPQGGKEALPNGGDGP